MPQAVQAEEELEYASVSPEEFAQVDLSQVSLVDLRDEALHLVQGELPGSYNVPLSQIGTGLKDLPKDKPVYVYCNKGDFSGEVAELLTDRGYEAYDVEGGFRAFKELLPDAIVDAPAPTDAASAPAPAPTASAAPATATSATPAQSADPTPGAIPAAVPSDEPIYLDAKGLKCPGPIVKVSDTLKELPAGQKVHVEATEDAFASDIRIWCERTGNVLESIEAQPGFIDAVIVKADPAPVATTQAELPNGKTFVVFSGDLDKTIAAFIMANGGAAMGREVTMFFTFWGLNILRRPEKVKVHKTFIGRAFGAMMPRGTKKLGLSRMNFGGAGAKMIRGVMKANGISSLEELIDQAREHGVRLVACQMSMEIMGITQEELIDGVELGGVATFLGSGEQSNMSLFI